jgi:3-oxoacyl-[acyl-carrier protein] reductase
MKTHEHRVAVVTGAGRGIGLETAIQMAGSGARVAMLDLDSAVSERAKELRDRGLHATGHQADVTDPEDINRVFQEVARQWGALHILVNNAGISIKPEGVKGGIEDITLHQWQKVLAVNLTGVFICSQAAVPYMRQAGWGRIISMSSQGGRTGGTFSSVDYSAAKSGVIGFSRTLAKEVGPSGITVNCIAPGRVATDMTSGQTEAKLNASHLAGLPIARMARTSEIAASILFLTTEEAGYITGATLDINGGGFMA